MDALIYGPGTVTFYWRTAWDQGDEDELRFYIDGVLQDEVSGELAWTQKSYSITGQGVHVLMWEHEKDGTQSCNCWVDYLTWTGDTEPSDDDWDICEYVYDPAGRRIEKKFDGETAVKYLYDGDQCIAEYDGDDNLLRKYIYGPGIDQPICIIDVEDSNAVSYYHYDALGSVVALSDANGDTIQVYEYDVYGNVAASDPNHTNPFMFTGRRLDSETGLYFYRARTYNPALGRFLQTDPIGYGDGMNWYAYCGNNPVSWIDPFGCETWKFGYWDVCLGGNNMLLFDWENIDDWPEDDIPQAGIVVECASDQKLVLEEALQKLWDLPTGRKLLEEIRSRYHYFKITIDKLAENRYVYADREVIWNPESEAEVSVQANLGSYKRAAFLSKKRPPAYMTLGHELIHHYMSASGYYDRIYNHNSFREAAAIGGEVTVAYWNGKRWTPMWYWDFSYLPITENKMRGKNSLACRKIDGKFIKKTCAIRIRRL